MASNSVLQPVTARGWRAGFSNLFRKENRDWWGTRSWLRQAIIWTAILIGILATVLFAPMENDPSLLLLGGRSALGLVIFFAVAGTALPIGAIIMGQEEVLDECGSSTATSSNVRMSHREAHTPLVGAVLPSHCCVMPDLITHCAAI